MLLLLSLIFDNKDVKELVLNIQTLLWQFLKLSLFTDDNHKQCYYVIFKTFLKN